MTDRPQPQAIPIAVVGVGALFPGSTDAGGFWRDILAGTDLMTDVPPDHWLIEDYYDPDPAAADKTYARRGAFLPKVDFDPVAFGIPPNAIPATDTSQLLALIVARQVLADASRGQFERLDRERISVILGATSGQELMAHLASRLQRPIWVKALRESGLSEAEVQATCDRIAASFVPWQESSFPGLLGNVVAGRIANRFDLGGTNCVTDAACASALSAVAMAVNELYQGQSDLVISGGVDTYNDIFMYMCFSKTPALSPTGDCRPFDAASDGTMLGEGLGMVALKRLADAERDGDRIYAVLRGLGSSSDGRAMSIYAPLAAGQAKALRRAYRAAGYGPETVELVEAHGTGTRAGDAAEFEGLRAVFSETGREDKQWCALGSIKSQIGHTKAAAGAAGLFKAVMALHHKVLPPTIKVSQPNPKLDIANGPFYLNTRARPWVRDGAHPRRASVSSFGFGGSNFHVTLEEYAGPGERAPRVRANPAELVILTAGAPAGLLSRCRELIEEAGEPGYLPFLADATQRAFDPEHTARLAVVAEDEADLWRKLAQAAEAIAGKPGEAFSSPAGIYYGVGPRDGELAFLFPGQGSQYVGMGADLAMTFDAARAAWDLAAGLPLAPDARLHEVVFPRPAFSDDERATQARRLTATEWAQPALGAASLALLGVLDRLGIAPVAAAGHSFGEVAALHAAGVLDAPQLLQVARRRGELMAEAARQPGAMTAVQHGLTALEPLLASWGLDVTVANHNSPQQLVLSGTVPAIEAAERQLQAAGISFRRLPVATAFHSPVVDASAVPFRAFLEAIPFGEPRFPVYANATAEAYPAGAAGARDQLAAQIARPVRFAEVVEALYRRGVRTFLEVGPGAVLTGLVGQCLEGRPHQAVNLDRKGGHGLTCLWHALGRLAAAGIPMDLGRLWQGYAPPPDPRLRARPALAIALDGSNHGKPYPPAGGAAALPAPNLAPRGNGHGGAVQEIRALRPTRAAETTYEEPKPMAAPDPAPAAAHNSTANGGGTSAPAAAYPDHGQVAWDGAGETQAWIAAHDQAQQRLAEAHASFQRTLGDGYLALVRASESSFHALCAAATGQPLPGAGAPPAPAPVPQASLPPPPPSAAPGPAPAAAIMQAPPSPPQPIAAAPAAPLPAAAGLEATLLAVVADKTGYPAEMLKPEMALEADLGIDSIKRVEILAALQDRVPGLPEVDAGQMARLHTLGQIVGYMQGNGWPRAETPPPAPAAVVHERQLLPRYVVREVPAPASGQGLLGQDTQGLVAITDDGTGIAQALAGELTTAGMRAEVVERVPGDAVAVLFLGGLGAVADAGAGAEICRAAFQAAQAVAVRFSLGGGVFVTVQDTGGDFGLSGAAGPRAWVGGLAALAKTAAREWPRARVKAIDLARGGRDAAALARALAQELRDGGPEMEVGLHADGTRTTIEGEPASPAEGVLAIKENSLVVASGGGRGVTAATLIGLARQARPRIALLGRTELRDEPPACRGVNGDAALKQALLEAARVSGAAPGPAELGRQVRELLAAREVRATMDALRAAGSEVRYDAVDIRDGAAVAAALADVRRQWGPITALVHGAGVLADKTIAEKTAEQFERVYSTKVAGAQALLAATADDPLDVICVFSSIAARTGNPGQCDYAMANETLNKVAAAEARRRGGRCLVKAIGWGPWDGGMVDAGLRAHFEKQGVALIPIEAGVRCFLAELQDAPGQAVEVLLGASLPAPSGPPGGEISLPLRVDGAGFGYLRDHQPKGVPVLPVVLALEWFARAARACRPDLQVVACRDLQVLKGAMLRHLDGEGDAFTVRCRQLEDGARPILGAELRGADDELHYSATLEMAAELPPAGSPLAIAGLGPWAQGAPYEGRLFHGPRFQVIRALAGVSGRGITGELRGTAEMGWPGGDWETDPAALDGGMQLAILWGLYEMGKPSLPTGFGEYIRYERGLAQGPVHCLARGEVKGQYRAVFQVCFMAGERVVAELRDLEMTMRPGDSFPQPEAELERPR